MNVQEIQGLYAIRPLTVADYLKGHGWAEEPTGEKTSAIFARQTKKGAVRVRVLLDETLGDFPVRMAEALDVIARLEGRPLYALVNDVLTVRAVPAPKK